MPVAIVESVNRTTASCIAQKKGSANPQTDASAVERPAGPVKYYGSPPPPLSFIDALEVDPGLWRVNGVLADRRLVTNEDFMTVTWSAPYAYCDEVWAVIVGGTPPVAGVSQFAIGAGGGEGVCAVQAGASSGSSSWLTKDDGTMYLVETQGYWYSARLMPTVNTSFYWSAGFGNQAGTYSAYVEYDTATGFTNLVTENSGSSSLTIPYTSSNAAWTTIDIVLYPGAFVAAWVDGDGPYVSTTQIPVAGRDVAPFAYSYSYTSAIRNLAVDWIRVETFTPCANPTRDLILPASQASG